MKNRLREMVLILFGFYANLLKLDYAFYEASLKVDNLRKALEKLREERKEWIKLW